MTKDELTQKSEQNNSMEQKQIQAPLGIHLPENEDAIKLLKDMKSIFRKCAARSTNGYDFERLFRYFELFLEHEKERSFLMYRISDLIMDCGEAWFDDQIPDWIMSEIKDIDEWTKQNKGYNSYKEWQQAVHEKQLNKIE